jgi:hypothetical protein
MMKMKSIFNKPIENHFQQAGKNLPANAQTAHPTS